MTTSEGPFLLDSNILIYAADSHSQFYTQCKALITRGLKGEELLCVCPQVLLEFFAVVTNPKRVTQPLPPEEAMEEVRKYLRAKNILKIYPGEDIVERIAELSRRHSVSGPRIFDLKLVATMISNGVRRLYTYNEEHFKNFEEIDAVVP